MHVQYNGDLGAGFCSMVLDRKKIQLLQVMLGL